jgi:hypothetical protein
MGRFVKGDDCIVCQITGKNRSDPLATAGRLADEKTGSVISAVISIIQQ